MDWNLVVTDMSGRNRAFPTDWDSLKVTRRLGDYNEGQMVLDIYDPNGAQVLIGQRAVKFYRGNSLKLYGTIWEPLEKAHPDGITVNVRDPFALWAWRRCRALQTYTATDAGAIVSSRITLQNGFQDTHLRIGAIAASVNRTITINPGKREDEFIEDLSGMSSGFFFLINPVDGAGATFAELVVLYPNAGVTREEVRFEYGKDTRDNLEKMKIIQMLPRTRETAASSAATGGRIASTVEDTTSQAIYNIIEDEIAVSDITDTNILQAFAQAEIRTAPPEQYELTPNLNSPLLFQDFDVGDFCRLRVKDGTDDIFTWVRVTEATLSVDKDGVESLDRMVVETLVGGKPYSRPEDLFRQEIDAMRARQEMLERKVENITATTAAPPATGGGSAPPPDPTYVPPPPTYVPPPPASSPPPPAPDIPPTVSGVNAYGTSTSSGTVEFDIDPGSSTTGVSVAISQGGVIRRAIDAGTTDAPRHYAIDVSSLSRSSHYDVQVFANNAAGQASGTGGFNTFNSDL